MRGGGSSEIRLARFAAGLFCLGLLFAGGGSSLQAQDLGNEQQRAEGKVLYDKFCAQCHGLTGDGFGYAAHRVKPKPRDFRSGKYKFRTTPSGMMPTDDDIRKVIRDGLPYTSMPAWPSNEWPGFTDQQVQEIIYYLKTFSEDFQNPDKYQDPIRIPTPPAMTDESVTRGRASASSRSWWQWVGAAAVGGSETILSIRPIRIPEESRPSFGRWPTVIGSRSAGAISVCRIWPATASGATTGRVRQCGQRTRPVSS